jgi:hypothetical protein
MSEGALKKKFSFLERLFYASKKALSLFAALESLDCVYAVDKWRV